MESASEIPRRRAYRMEGRARAAEQTRQRILSAAAELFDERLYDQVGLGDVAERADVTVQTVIRRFGAKDELFAAMVHERSPDARRARDRVPAGDVDEAVACLTEDHERVGTRTLHLLSQERRSTAIADAVAVGRDYHHAWTARVFGPQLDRLDPPGRERALAQLIAGTDLYTWKVLRDDVGLDVEHARAAMTDLVRRVLD